MNLPERGFYPGSVDLFTGQPIAFSRPEPLPEPPPQPDLKPELPVDELPAQHYKDGDPQSPDDILSAGQAGKLIGLTRDQVASACRLGWIPRIDGGFLHSRWGIRRRDLPAIKAEIKARRPYKPKPKGYVGSAEAAKILGVNTRTMNKHWRNGDFGASTYRKGNLKKHCFRLDMLEEAVRNGQQTRRRGAVPPEGYVSTREAAAIVGVSDKSMRRRARSGHYSVKTYRNGPLDCYWFPVSELKREMGSD